MMNTKLAIVFQGKINYCPQSSDYVLGFWNQCATEATNKHFMDYNAK